ncbi:MAG TPA: pitrilysin family protein [Bdellovibrionota bacterium]|jgi:zinc protease
MKKTKKTSSKKPSATKLILLPEKKGPLVHLEFALTNGSLRDPAGKEGVASLTLSMLLRGTQKRSSQEFHRALDNIGGEIHLGKYKESQRIYGVCLSDKLPAFLDLVEEMLVEPAFREDEFVKIRDQMRSSLLDELGSDDEIADRRFQEYMLWGNSYGRMTSGSLESLGNISAGDLKTFHQKYFRAADFVVGASGGFDKAKLEKRLKALLARLPQDSSGRLDAEAPSFRAGKALLLLDKPNRTQAQIYVGSPGISFSHKDYFAMLIANHVFGGSSFSARLMKEVREKRGWSYGCYSWYRSGKQPLYFGMHAVPSNKDALPALKLMLQLFQQYGREGVTKQEFDFAKKSLVSQSAFLQDALRKRLDHKVTEAVLGLPKGFYDGYQRKLASLTYAQVQKAVKKHVDPTRIFALVLGSVDQLGVNDQGAKGFSKVWMRKFDEPAMDLSAANPYIVAGRGESRKAESPVELSRIPRKKLGH